MSERVASWAWPAMAMPAARLWAEMDEPRLLMRAVAGPVTPERSMSPWLAVTVTAPLMEATWMSPRLAVAVMAEAGTVRMRSARAPSIAGMVRESAGTL